MLRKLSIGVYQNDIYVGYVESIKHFQKFSKSRKQIMNLIIGAGYSEFYIGYLEYLSHEPRITGFAWNNITGQVSRCFRWQMQTQTVYVNFIAFLEFLASSNYKFNNDCFRRNDLVLNYDRIGFVTDIVERTVVLEEMTDFNKVNLYQRYCVNLSNIFREIANEQY